MRPSTGALAMVVAAFFFAAVECVAAQLHEPHSMLQVVWTRYGVHLLVVGALAASRRQNPLRTHRLGTQIFRSLLMVGMPGCFVVAVALASANSVWALFWIAPLLAMSAGARWLREPVDTRLWSLAGVGFVAILVMLRPLRGMRWEAAVFAVGMAACFSGYLVMTRALRHETTLSRLFYTALGVFVVLTPFVPWVYRPPTFHDWIVLWGIGLLGLACLWCLDVALDAEPASRMAPLLYATPAFFAVMLGMMGRRGIGKSTLAGIGLTAITLWACWPRALPRRSTATG